MQRQPKKVAWEENHGLTEKREKGDTHSQKKDIKKNKTKDKRKGIPAIFSPFCDLS